MIELILVFSAVFAALLVVIKVLTLRMRTAFKKVDELAQKKKTDDMLQAAINDEFNSEFINEKNISDRDYFD